MSFIESARYYAAKGWRIIPLNWVKGDGSCSCGREGCAVGKHPWLAQWPVKATTDEAVWGAWWRERPQSQIGIATGEASGLWVLDVDGPVGVSTLQDLEAQYGPLPPTWVVRTGSGGLHFYFRWPKNLGDRVFTVDAGVFPGIDYRANGGQVVAPPSRNLKGSYYVMENSEVADAPDWLVDLLAKEPPRKVEYVPAALTGEGIDRRVQSWVQSCCNRVATSASGMRNKTLYAAARSAAEVVAAHGTMTEDQAAGMFLQAAESAGLTAREARVTFWSGWGDGYATPKPLEERPLVKSGGWRRTAEPVPVRAADVPVELPPVPPVEAEYGGGDDDPGLPHIQINGRPAREIVSECWELFTCQRVPTLFQQEGRLVRIVEADNGRIIRLVDSQVLRAMLNQRAAFMKVFDRKDGRVEEHAGAAPAWISEDMVSIPKKELAFLESIVSAPFFLRGELVVEPGYHREARCWLEEHGCQIEAMTVDRARAVFADWLVDFCFEEDFDRINAIALVLLPFVRRMIQGPTPGHLIEASTPGSGKGLLAKILLLPSLGEAPHATPFAESEEERRKSLMAALIEGRPVTLIDNLKGKVDSPVLEGILTSDVWQDRMLGVTGTAHAANKTTWVLTGNNADLSLDMARRCLRIRLDQGVERPYDQDRVYAHPDIEDWTKQNRSQIISAVVALVKNWIEKGKPKPDKNLGSFESWSWVVGGILKAAGYGNWLEGREGLIQNADRQGDQLKHFVEVWAQEIGSVAAYTPALVGLAENHGLLLGTLGDGTERSKQTRLGAFLGGKARGRVFSVLVAGQSTRWRVPEQSRDRTGAHWVLERIDKPV